MEEETHENSSSETALPKTEESKKAFSIPPVTRESGAPGVKLDFNVGVRLRFPEGEEGWHVRITDQDAMLVLYDADVRKSSIDTKKKHYINFLVELWKDGYKVLSHPLSLAGQNVRFALPCGGVLGDILAWIPYVEAFRKKHGCEAYCMLPAQQVELFRPAYPEIHFLLPEDEFPDCYATYFMGAYEDSYLMPVDHRVSGLSGCIPFALGLENRELRPVLTPCSERPIREPYVCIATQSTAQRKYWNNPRGWPVTIEYLKGLGFRVLCIDQKRANPIGDHENVMPEGAEDFTGDLPLQQRVDLLGHADFFIGLSSGLSWLAWGAGTPVVLISGFTYPFYEFYTPYRVIQYHTCYGCWNDKRLPLFGKDGLYCPRHEGTARAFECSRNITPELVCKTIDRLMADHGLMR